MIYLGTPNIFSTKLLGQFMKQEQIRQFWITLFYLTDYYRESLLPLQSSGNRKAILALTVKQIRVLKKVHQLTKREKQGIQLKTLTQALGVTAGTASEIVETLVKRGDLERKPHELDRRAILLKLSPRAKQMCQDHEKIFDKQTELMLEHFSEIEQEQFSQLFNKLLNLIPHSQGDKA